jgi:hypothetical protein
LEDVREWLNVPVSLPRSLALAINWNSRFEHKSTPSESIPQFKQKNQNSLHFHNNIISA